MADAGSFLHEGLNVRAFPASDMAEPVSEESMKRLSFRLCSTAVAFALVACNESTSPAALITDEDIATDVATTSGSAIAIDVQNMVGNWSGGGFPAGANPLASTPVVD